MATTSSSSGYDISDNNNGGGLPLDGLNLRAWECQRKMQRLCGILAAAIVARDGGVGDVPRTLLRTRTFLCVAFYDLHGRCFEGVTRVALGSRGGGNVDVNGSYVALSSLVFQRMSTGISEATASSSIFTSLSTQNQTCPPHIAFNCQAVAAALTSKDLGVVLRWECEMMMIASSTVGGVVIDRDRQRRIFGAVWEAMVGSAGSGSRHTHTTTGPPASIAAAVRLVWSAFLQCASTLADHVALSPDIVQGQDQSAFDDVSFMDAGRDHRRRDLHGKCHPYHAILSLHLNIPIPSRPRSTVVISIHFKNIC